MRTWTRSPPTSRPAGPRPSSWSNTYGRPSSPRSPGARVARWCGPNGSPRRSPRRSRPRSSEPDPVRHPAARTADADSDRGSRHQQGGSQMLLRPRVGRGRPGLLGTMARTAVVAGTATATVNAVGNRQSRRQQAAAEQQAAQQAVVDQQQAAPAAAGDDMMTQLKQLGDMKASGLLTDDEFAAAKAK